MVNPKHGLFYSDRIMDKDVIIRDNIISYIKADNMESLKRAFEQNGIENPSDALRWSYLHYAAFNNNTQAARVCLQSGIDINAVDIDNQTALFIAIREEAVKMVNFLLKKGVDLNIRNVYDYTALELAKLRAHMKSADSIEARKRVRIVEIIEKFIADNRLKIIQKRTFLTQDKYPIQKIKKELDSKVI